MQNNILENIINKKIKKIELLKKSLSEETIKENILKNKNFFNFKTKIENNIKNDKISIIADVLTFKLSIKLCFTAIYVTAL